MAESLRQTSKKRTKRNWKAVMGILIPFIPILAAMISILTINMITDFDVIILALILISPIFFVIGAVISTISFKGSGGKILPIIGLIINVIFLVVDIYILINVKVN